MSREITSETRFARLEQSLSADVRALLAHPVYGELRSLADIRLLMESHIYAVWDFMSLVKALQREVTCVQIPWMPPSDPVLARFLNEIVLGEESDELGPDLYLSHCELYLRAMDEVGADVRPFNAFLSRVTNGQSPENALAELNAAGYIRDFVLLTLRVAREPAHCVAASFLFGREDVIPGMFRKILAEVDVQNSDKLKAFRLYLDRHISVDEGNHGPLARRLLVRLCGDDEMKWREAEETARQAIAARIRFWDGCLREIRPAAFREAEAFYTVRA